MLRRLAALTVAAAALAAPLLLPGTASAATAVTPVGAVTDNYKASYNADPAAPELRTWLQLRSVTAGGVVYRPASLPAAGSTFVDASTGLLLRGSDGGRARLTARTGSDAVTGQGSFRTDAAGPFGLLQTLRSREALRAAPVRETFVLRVAGSVVGTFPAVYRYDPAVADAPATSIEHGGPGGRWSVSGTATRLDWESAQDTAAPVLADLVLPATTTTRSVQVGLTATDDVAVAQVRLANEDGVWGAWQPFAATVSWTLSSTSAAYKGVSAQVRDAAGHESAVLYRRTTCSCG